MTVFRIPRRRCDDCGEFASCCGVNLGWYCSRCAPSRMATVRLADALEDMAEAAGGGPEAADSVARALRRGAGSTFWGEALLAAADRIGAAGQPVQEGGNGDAPSPGDFAPEMAAPGAELLEKAKTADLACDFPDLATAYDMGREYGPKLDEDKRKAYEGYAKRCGAMGWAPCETRKFMAPDEQRWAVSYLRHRRSKYDEVYRQLQDVVWELPMGGRGVLEEQVHRIIKNRVQDRIAEDFPELAEAAEEQKV